MYVLVGHFLSEPKIFCTYFLPHFFVTQYKRKLQMMKEKDLVLSASLDFV